jgi:hypothetical protein
MTNLHKLKIKYEQSQLAERVAWEAWLGVAGERSISPSTVPYSAYRYAVEAYKKAQSVHITAQADYEDELDRYWCVVGRVSAWVSAACMVYLIVWSMT